LRFALLFVLVAVFTLPSYVPVHGDTGTDYNNGYIPIAPLGDFFPHYQEWHEWYDIWTIPWPSYAPRFYDSVRTAANPMPTASEATNTSNLSQHNFHFNPMYMPVNFYIFQLVPRFGYSFRGYFHANRNSFNFDTSFQTWVATSQRQFSNHPGFPVRYYRSISQIGQNIHHIFLWEKIELYARGNFAFTSVVGYSDIQNRTLEVARMRDFNYPIPSVPTFEPFPPYPGQHPEPGPDFNAILETLPTNNIFNFGTIDYFTSQGVDIRFMSGTVPAQYVTRPLGVAIQQGFPIGTHNQDIILRHGPAEVGRFTLSLRVERPVTHVDIAPPNRGAGGPSYDGELNIDLTVLQRDPNALTGRVPYHGIPAQDMGYNYLGNPTTPAEKDDADIIVVIPPPCPYTFFVNQGEGFFLNDIVIDVPPGYSEVSRSIDAGGNLVVVITPNENGGGTDPNCREYHTPNFTITKNLRLPTGTVPPNRNFYFNITLADFRTGIAPSTPPTITIPGVTLPLPIPFANNTTTSAGGSGYITASNNATFNFNNVDWPSIGYYTFQVREVIPASNPAVGTNEIVVYDENVFYIFLQVGWICDDFEDLGILAYRTQRWFHCGDIACPTEANHTPFWPGECACGLIPCVCCSACGWQKSVPINFRNDFIRTGPFEVTKTVVGNFADPEKDFDFSISMTLPALVPSGYRNLVTARVYRNDTFNRTETLTFNQNDRTASASFVLRHNEKIVFSNVPYGTEFTLIETFDVYYRQTAEAIRAGEPTPTSTYGQTGTNNLVIPGRIEQRLHEGAVVTGNRVDVTNDQDAAAPWV